MKKWGWAGLFLLAAAGIFSFQQPAYAVASEEETVIEQGVYAGDVDLGGLNREEAKEKLDAYYQQMAASPFTVSVNGQPVETTLAKLGFSWDSETAV